MVDGQYVATQENLAIDKLLKDRDAQAIELQAVQTERTELLLQLDQLIAVKDKAKSAHEESQKEIARLTEELSTVLQQRQIGDTASAQQAVSKDKMNWLEVLQAQVDHLQSQILEKEAAFSRLEALVKEKEVALAAAQSRNDAFHSELGCIKQTTTIV